ncbi:hypothetical protein [Amycolatopsis sp. NPDC059657]|uniref:hypothetical protein n=1 Tax=Amycolatopsis sp. NPDC059657 TaxID=3346899 RepID=UPI003670C28F
MTDRLVLDRRESFTKTTIGCATLVAVFGAFWIFALVADLWHFGIPGLIATGPLGLILLAGGARGVAKGAKRNGPRALVVAGDGVSWLVRDKPEWRFGWHEIRGVGFKQVYYDKEWYDKETDERDYTMWLKLAPSGRQDVENVYTESEVSQIKEVVELYADLDVKQQGTVKSLPEFRPSPKTAVTILPNAWSRANYVLFYGSILAVAALAGLIGATFAEGEFRKACLGLAFACLISPLASWMFFPQNRGKASSRTTLIITPKGLRWSRDPEFGIWWRELDGVRLTPVGRRRHQVELVPASSDFEIRHDDLAPLLKDGVYVLPRTFSPAATAQLRETLATMRPGVVSVAGGY